MPHRQMTRRAARLRLGRWFAALATVACVSPGGVRAADWDEAVNGDLSNDRTAPSSFDVTAGVNSLAATMPGSDLDYVTLHVPADHELSGVTLVSYASSDGTSFIGMEEGTEVTTIGSATPLLGWVHFGTGPGNVGDDILPAMCNGAGAMGCSPPLASGAYSFWIQQQSPVNVSYQFDFTVTALEPDILAGDFNNDGVVDAADYAVWRDNLGAPEGTLDNDPDGGAVGSAQYDTWRANFGATLDGASTFSGAAAAPEPATLVLLVLAIGAHGRRASRRGAKGQS